jgi:hypothetical protein
VPTGASFPLDALGGAGAFPSFRPAPSSPHIISPVRVNAWAHVAPLLPPGSFALFVFPVSTLLLSALSAPSGPDTSAYFALHTSAFPVGEVRGQLSSEYFLWGGFVTCVTCLSQSCIRDPCHFPATCTLCLASGGPNFHDVNDLHS